MEDLILKREYVAIREIKGLSKPNENCLRVYRTQIGQPNCPGTFNLQIMTHGAITEFGKGTKRDMKATISLTVPELKQVLLYMEACERN